MWWFAAVLALCGCDQVFGLDRGPGSSKPITLHPTTAATLSDFPIAILLPSDADLAAARGDLFVTDASDVELPSELELFDPSTGQLAMWVRIPVLAGAPAVTTIHLHFGGTHADANARVWPDDAAAIYHLGDSALDRCLDSSAHANTLRAPAPTSEPLAVPGIAGGARAFDGANARLTAATNASLDPTDRAFSFSLWVNVTDHHNDYDMPLFRGGETQGDPGFDVELGAADWEANVDDGPGIIAGVYGGEGALTHRWTFLVSVIDRDSGLLRSYTDGVPQPAAGLAGLGAISTTKPLELSPIDNPFLGTLDEVELYHRALTPEWIATEYDNLAHADTFFTVGAAE